MVRDRIQNGEKTRQLAESRRFHETYRLSNSTELANSTELTNPLKFANSSGRSPCVWRICDFGRARCGPNSPNGEETYHSSPTRFGRQRGNPFLGSTTFPPM